jgi:hypothetical protein
MKTALLRDFVGILLVYAIYAMVTVWLYDPEQFLGDDPPLWPIWMWAGSLLCMLLWYVLGEWVIRPNAHSLTWLAAWFGLLGLVLILAVVVSFLENTDSYWWLHFAGGVGAYYVSSVLFSPLFAEYRIWPAKLLRRW